MPKRMLSAGKRMRLKVTQPVESYPDYLRRVGGDHAASGMEFTAQDYEEAATLIDDMKELIDYLNQMAKPDAHSMLAARVQQVLKRVTR